MELNRTTKSSPGTRIGERSSLYDLVSSFFQDVHPRHDGDEHGLLMNFDETCASIAVGQLSIGIRVTAPKIRDRLRVLDDNDYLSDDEEEEYVKTRQQIITTSDMRSDMNVRVSSQDGGGGPPERKFQQKRCHTFQKLQDV